VQPLPLFLHDIKPVAAIVGDPVARRRSGAREGV